MPRRSIAEIVIRKVGENDKISRYIVAYDFEVSNRGRIPSRFYENLKRILESFNDGNMIQRSVIICRKLRSAMAIAELVKYYGGNVKIFRVVDEVF